MKASVTLLTVLIGTLLFSGCSEKPTDADKIENLYKAYVTKSEGGKLLYDKILDIQHFTKINGLDKDANTYIAEVTLDRVFKIDSKNIPNLLTKDQLTKIFGRDDIFSNIPRLELMSSNNLTTNPPSIYSLYAHFKAGDSLESCSKFGIEIVKTDNGWIVNQVSCARPTEKQLLNMYNAYFEAKNGDNKNIEYHITDIKNFVKVNEIEQADKTYIANVKFDRVYNVGLNDLRDKLSPEQFNQLSAQRGSFKAGDKQVSGQLQFQMINVPEGWVINQIGF